LLYAPKKILIKVQFTCDNPDDKNEWIYCIKKLLKEFQKIEAHKKKQVLESPVDRNILLRTDSTNIIGDIDHKPAPNSPSLSPDSRNSARGKDPKPRHSGTLDTFTSIFKRKAGGDRNSRRAESEPGNTNSMRGSSKFSLGFLAKGSKMKESDDTQDTEHPAETESESQTIESPKEVDTNPITPKDTDTNPKSPRDTNPKTPRDSDTNLQSPKDVELPKSPKDTDINTKTPKDVELPKSPKDVDTDTNPKSPRDTNPKTPRDTNPKTPRDIDTNLKSPRDTDTNPKSPRDTNPKTPRDIDTNLKSPRDTNPKTPRDTDTNPKSPKADRDIDNKEDPKDSEINGHDKEHREKERKEKELSLKPKPKLRDRFSSFRKNKEKEEQKATDNPELKTPTK